MVGKVATAILCVLWGSVHLDARALAEPQIGLTACRANYQDLKLKAALLACTDVVRSHGRPSVVLTEALVVRGLTHFDLGRLDLALADLTSALELDPRNEVVLHHRANVFNELGLAHHAVRDYGAALAIDPFYAEAYINRAIAYQRGGHLSRAREDADTAYLLKPDDPRIATVRNWLEPES